MLAKSSQNSTGFEGVHASGGGFGAELQKGAKWLRQDGFRSPVGAALARARWTKSLGEGKGHAPSTTAGRSSGEQEQLAAEALVDLAMAEGTSEVTVTVPHEHGAAANGSSTCSTVEDKFSMHVLCNYTPRVPGELPMKRWVSCAQLLCQLQPHTPAEDNVRQLIMNHFNDHPAFAGHPFHAWCKMLKDNDAPAGGGRKNVMKFSLEYTPT